MSGELASKYSSYLFNILLVVKAEDKSDHLEAYK